MRKTKTLFVAIGTTIALALPALSHADPSGIQAPATTIDIVAHGEFGLSADGTTISGTYPPGYTLSNPPADPSDPGLRKGLLHAAIHRDLRLLSVKDPAVAQREQQCNNSVIPCGCVYVDASVDRGAGLLKYKGWVSGCSRSTHTVHTYINNASTHQRIADDTPYSCGVDTQCGPILHQRYYAAIQNCTGKYDLYSHGTSGAGGDDIAWMSIRPVC